MAVSKDEVVRAAVQLERDGRKMYLDMAQKASNAMTRRMFESLADDETLHIEWIENLEPGAKSAGEANRDTYRRLSHIFADVSETEKEKAASAEKDLEAIDLAVDMEEKSRVAYTEWAKESGDEEVQRLCTILADVERFHREVLENSKEYFQKPGDWFMQEERWMFDGG
jgi:rubrerythrin